MLRLAWCSPLPPARSGIADYSVEFLEELSQHAHVSLFTTDPAAIQAPSLDHLPRYPLEDLEAHRLNFDLPIYHLGNNIIHEKIYQQAARLPGIVVLHEFSLESFFYQMQAAQHPALLLRELNYEQQILGRGQLNQIDFPLGIPCNRRLVDGSLGVMVHSQYVADQIAADADNRTTTNIHVTQHVAQIQPNVTPWPDGEPFVFACAGQMTATKQIDKVLDCLRRLVDEGVPVQLKLIGEPLEGLPVEDWIDARGLSQQVQLTGFIESKQAFEAEIGRAHALINLREPTMGETSGAVIRAMAQGRPVIVTDHGWYAELPDCCPKVLPGSAAELYKMMKQLAVDRDLAQTLGQRAFEHIRKKYAPAVVVQDFLSWLEQSLDKIYFSNLEAIS